MAWKRCSGQEAFAVAWKQQGAGDEAPKLWPVLENRYGNINIDKYIYRLRFMPPIPKFKNLDALQIRVPKRMVSDAKMGPKTYQNAKREPKGYQSEPRDIPKQTLGSRSGQGSNK